MNSIEVIQILHGLEQVHSTYADAFIDVHRDVRKVNVQCIHIHVRMITCTAYDTNMMKYVELESDGNA